MFRWLHYKHTSRSAFRLFLPPPQKPVNRFLAGFSHQSGCFRSYDAFPDCSPQNALHMPQFPVPADSVCKRLPIPPPDKDLRWNTQNSSHIKGFFSYSAPVPAACLHLLPDILSQGLPQVFQALPCQSWMPTHLR